MVLAVVETEAHRHSMAADCGHDYATHEKSLRGELIYVYRDPRTDEPCDCDQFTITMKRVGKTKKIEPRRVRR